MPAAETFGQWAVAQAHAESTGLIPVAITAVGDCDPAAAAINAAASGRPQMRRLLRGLHAGRRRAGAPERISTDGVPRMPARRVSVRGHRVVLLLSVGLRDLAVHRCCFCREARPGPPVHAFSNLDRQRKQAGDLRRIARAVPCR